MGKALLETVPSPSAEGRRVAPSKTLKRSSTACLERRRDDEVMVIRDFFWMVIHKEIENVYDCIQYRSVKVVSRISKLTVNRIAYLKSTYIYI